MKLLYQSVLLGVVSLGLVACSEENPWNNYAAGEGKVQLSLTSSSEVFDAVPVSRATVELEAPDAEAFKIRMEKKDGSFSKEWNSLKEFHAESFTIGTYSLTAYHGDSNAEGFDLPYYEGKTDVTVIEARTTEVDLTASLANTMLSISYTDAFKSHFKGYAATVHSEGHSYVAYTSEKESTPVHIQPGLVDIAIQVTDNQNRTVSLQPAKFDALACHHYHITIDVKGGQGTGSVDQLVVSFDDSIQQEEVTIDLTEELFTSKAPTVNPAGFTSGQVVEYLEGDNAPSDVQFDIIAMGGLSSVILTVNSPTYTPSFGNEIDLMSASDYEKSFLEQSGIICKGLWGTTGKMAFVNLKEFCRHLPAGRHELTIVAKDNFMRISEPVSIVFDTNAVSVEMEARPINLGDTQGVVEVSYNGGDLGNKFSFAVMNDFGIYEDCQILSVETLNNTRALPITKFAVTLSLPDSFRGEIPVRAFYKGDTSSPVAEFGIPVNMPPYSVAADAYASEIVFKVSPENPSDMGILIKAMSIFVNGNEVYSNLERDEERGLVILSGLTPDTQYKVFASILEPEDNDYLSVRTEKDNPVPNGDFETLVNTYNNVTINQGGQYTRTLIGAAMQNTQNFTVSEPEGWKSNNSTTCNTGLASQYLNSWFVTPAVFNSTLSFTSTVATNAGMGGQKSTPDAYKHDAYHGENAMVIRSVGWSHNGTVPDKDSKAAATETNYYNTKVPGSFNKAAGTLYLSENNAEGCAFTSRPVALTGYYNYTNDSKVTTEKARVIVQVLSGTTVIGTATATLAATSAGYHSFRVPITYKKSVNFGLKPTMLKIRFSSADNDNPAVTSYAERFRQESTGAVLLIDNLSFEY